MSRLRHIIDRNVDHCRWKNAIKEVQCQSKMPPILGFLLLHGKIQIYGIVTNLIGFCVAIFTKTLGSVGRVVRTNFSHDIKTSLEANN